MNCVVILLYLQICAFHYRRLFVVFGTISCGPYVHAHVVLEHFHVIHMCATGEAHLKHSSHEIPHK